MNLASKHFSYSALLWFIHMHTYMNLLQIIIQNIEI